jgi:NADH-quinone oxidoreductase subunit N
VEINFAAIAPELILVVTAALIILADAFIPGGLPRAVIVSVAVFGLAAAAILAVPLFAHATTAFFGTIAVDPFAAYFKILLVAAAAVIILASGSLLEDIDRYKAEFVGLILLATSGLMMLAAAADLITMYISLEISSLSIAFRAAWYKRDLRSTEAGRKYLGFSAISYAILVYGMALATGGSSPALFLGLTMLLAGFGFKISAVPFQMWTPDVYEGAPTVVTAFLSVASKSAGFAALIRVLTTALPAERADWVVLISIIALLTMTLGNIVALVQSNVKRMLAYSSIAQAGYVLVGVAAASSAGVSAVLFYLLAYTATNLCAFIAVIAITRAIGSEQIADFRGLHQRAPGLAFALGISLFSLAGLPPFAGFFAKLYVFWAAAQSGLLWLVLAAVINSAISLYYYAQVVHDMYLAPPSDEAEIATGPRTSPAMVSLGFTVAGVLLLGVFSGTFYSLQNVAANAVGR